MRLLRALKSSMRRDATRYKFSQSAKEDIAKLFESSTVRVLGGTDRCWGQHFDWSLTQHGIYGTSAGVQCLAMAGRSEDSPLMREADRVLCSLEDPAGQFQASNDHLNTYKLVFYVEGIEPTRPAITHQTLAAQRLVSAALSSGGWPDSRHATDDTPDATALATSSALWALRRFELFHGSDTCEAALRYVVSRHAGFALGKSLSGPTFMGYMLICLNSYARTLAADRVEGYAEARQALERRLTRWAKHRRRDDYFEQFRYDFVELPSTGASRDSDYIALMPDCLVALAFLEAPARLNAQRRRFVTHVLDALTDAVRDQSFRPRNVDRRSTVDHLWAQRVLHAFGRGDVRRAFGRKHRAQAAGNLSFWARVLPLFLFAGAATWVGLADSIKMSGALQAGIMTMGVLTGGLAVEMVAGRYLK
ncbi:hypothetical protein [Phycicoccus elongatus]|uniref:hypothetical protein n=1 Tax=Phycicoccus elongatus TaxID=101689 RepID=UPI0037841D2F